MSRSYPPGADDRHPNDVVDAAGRALATVLSRVHPLVWVAVGSAALTWFALR